MTETGKHTPGPWRATSDGAWVEFDPGYGWTPIANMCGYSQAYGVERITNAHLIAAAPELLGALETLVAEYDAWSFNGGVNVARAAIHKAKGDA